jgi:hypothetical protein
MVEATNATAQRLKAKIVPATELATTVSSLVLQKKK